jgi:hypothetical protein
MALHALSLPMILDAMHYRLSNPSINRLSMAMHVTQAHGASATAMQVHASGMTTIASSYSGIAMSARTIALACKWMHILRMQYLKL